MKKNPKIYLSSIAVLLVIMFISSPVMGFEVDIDDLFNDGSAVLVKGDNLTYERDNGNIIGYHSYKIRVFYLDIEDPNHDYYLVTLWQNFNPSKNFDGNWAFAEALSTFNLNDDNLRVYAGQNSYYPKNEFGEFSYNLGIEVSFPPINFQWSGSTTVTVPEVDISTNVQFIDGGLAEWYYDITVKSEMYEQHDFYCEIIIETDEHDPLDLTVTLWTYWWIPYDWFPWIKYKPTETISIYKASNPASSSGGGGGFYFIR